MTRPHRPVAGRDARARTVPARREPPRASRGTDRRGRRADGDPAAIRSAHARAARRGLVLLGALAALGCLQVVFMIGVELDRSLRHGSAITALEGELAELDREAEALRAVVRHADDDAFREQLARRQGFLYPGEARVVVLPDAAR